MALLKFFVYLYFYSTLQIYVFHTQISIAFANVFRTTSSYNGAFQPHFLRQLYGIAVFDIQRTHGHSLAVHANCGGRKHAVNIKDNSFYTT